METKFQLLDVDYVVNGTKPSVRLFGRTDKGKSITVFHDETLPYFYVLPKEGEKEKFKDYIRNNFSDVFVKFEEVGKFNPIGFSKKKMNLLKVFLNNPAKTPAVRDDILEKKLVDKIYEADILFKYRYMNDNKISGMNWYNVSGEGIRTDSVKTERKIKANKINEIQKEGNMKLKYLSFDIETISEEGTVSDWDKNEIIIISMFFYPSYQNRNTMVLAAKRVKRKENDIFGFGSEKEMLEKFVDIIDQFDPDFILGYNINNFDLPYLDARLRKNNIRRNIGRCTHKSFRTSKYLNRYSSVITGRVIVDVYDLIREGASKFGLYKGLKRFGLTDVSKLILDEDKIDVSHSEISSYWNEGGKKIEKLLSYARKDAELPLKILLDQQLLDKFIEICKVSGILLQDSLERGESIRVENLLLREFNDKDFVIPNKPTRGEISVRMDERRRSGLKGAFVLSPKIGFYDNYVIYLDFKSMYPSIFKSLNICTTTLLLDKDSKEKYFETPFGSKFVKNEVREGIFPSILNYLLDARSKVKDEMRAAKTDEKRKYLYAKQYAFKTVANAFYGYSGYLRARLYILDIASGITSTGRDSIKRTKKVVETKTPYKVIYGDTDSVMVETNTKDLKEAFRIGEELSDVINDEIKILQIKIESVFKTLLLLAKKRYAAWSFEPKKNGWDETILTKGIETVRRDWCDLVSETLEKVLVTLLKEQDVRKSVSIVKKIVNEIKENKVDINKLIITKSISRSLRSYKGVQPHVELVKKMRKRDPSSAPGVGDRIGYVIIKGSQLMSHRAEDPAYILEHNLKIDSKYYIESQLIPPLERVFESLNVQKSELIGFGKQLGVLDILKKEVKEENDFVDSLDKADGLICTGCNNVFRRPPLSGICNYCKGDLVFFNKDNKSKVFAGKHA